MFKSVLLRFASTTTACQQLYLHLTALSSLQLFERTSVGATTSTIRRGISKNASGDKTHCFHYFWQPCSGHFAEGITRVSKADTGICDKFGLSHIAATEEGIPPSSPIQKLRNVPVNLPVVFHLETTGLAMTSHILRIAASSPTKSFYRHVLPKIPIELQAEIVNRLTFVEGRLYHKGKQVDAVTIHQALSEFLEFLGDEPVTLFGHNCKRFGCLVLFNAVKSCDLMAHFEKKVTGYVDTLPMFKDVFPGLPSYSQISLYRHLFRKSYAAHVDMSDVTALKRLLDLPSVTPDAVFRHSFDLDYIREGVRGSLIKQKSSAS